MELLRLIVCNLVLLLLAGCAGGLGVNFQDGTWSSCTYSKADGISFTGPLQLGGAPLIFTKPNGTKVECVPIPKV